LGIGVEANHDPREPEFGTGRKRTSAAALVGAPGVNSVIDLGGAAYIFVRESGNNWVQYEMLTTPIWENIASSAIQWHWMGIPF